MPPLIAQAKDFMANDTITELRHAVETNLATAAVYEARSAHHQAIADSYDLDNRENSSPWFTAAYAALVAKRDALAARLGAADGQRELDELERTS